jgi:hypothetical protein
MSNQTDPHRASDVAASSTAADAKGLIDVTIPVPAAHLGSFFRAVATWFADEHDDEGWRGGRMTSG